MTKCRIAIAPNGENGLRFVLNAEILKTPQAGRVFSRSPRKTAVTDDELRQLQYGDAPSPFVDDVRVRLSKWFLAQDLEALVGTALDFAQGGEPITLVFSVDEALAADLGDTPFELIGLSGNPEGLVLNTRIASFIHLLPKVEAPINKTRSWPLRVLIVRSNPKDLGGAIPPADPMRQALRRIMAEDPVLNPELVKIDILSREDGPDLAGLPTVAQLENQLDRKEYDILVYIGHGDVSSSASPERKTGGVLQLEDETGENRATLDAGTLARLLGEQNPVPVVLLLGCLTATEDIPEDMREGVKELLPQWLSGSRGVAQVLINSASGVQFAIGMRYKIDTTIALLFFEHFFRSLLRNNPGNVEAAVRFARSRLARMSYMWSAPVVFSTLHDEPLFPFIEDRPTCPTLETHEKTRTLLWKNLAKVKWSLRDQDTFKELISDWQQSLNEYDATIAATMKEHNAAFVAPGFMEVKPGQEIRIPVKLFGGLKNVEEIEGKITISAGPQLISELKGSKLLSDSNFNLNSLDNNSGFLIRHSADGGSLAEGALFDILLTAPAETQGVLSVKISKLKTKPPMKVCEGDNAIVFPLP